MKKYLHIEDTDWSLSVTQDSYISGVIWQIHVASPGQGAVNIELPPSLIAAIMLAAESF